MSATRPPLSAIGREAELAEIGDFLDPSPAGPQALFLIGEPGMGKTTLWVQALAAATRLGYEVLSCHPAEAETKLSFTGLTDLFAGVEPELFETLPAPQRQAVDAALLRSDWSGKVNEHAVSAGVLTLLRALGESRPLLVAIDDLQWLDAPSERVLAFALRRTERERVRLVAAQRQDEGKPPRGGLIHELPRDTVEHVRLRPLAMDELDQLLEAHLGARLLRPDLARLHAASGGNPFFALEMLRALRRREAAGRPMSHLQLPESLSDLVRERLAMLDPPSLQAVRLASMLPEPSYSTLIAAMDGGPAALEGAQRMGVIEVDGDTIGFTHPLLAGVAYSDIPEDDRRALHRLLANLVGDQEQRARHLALGTLGSDESVAASVAGAAAQAEARGAPSSAAELADRAVRLTPPDLAESAWGRRIFAARNYLDYGEMGRGRSLLHEVIDAAPSGLLRAEALLLLGDWTDDPRTAIDLLERALAEAEGAPTRQSDIRCHLVGQNLSLANMEAAAAHARIALQLAEGTRQADPIAAALMRVAEVGFLAGEGLQAALIERALSLRSASRWLLTASWMHSASGELGVARTMLHELLARADERGEETMASWADLELSDLEYRAGDWDAAYRYAEAGHALALKTRWEPFLPWGLVSMAKVHAGLGELGLARSEALESMALFEAAGQTLYSIVFPLPLLGFIELSAGDPAAAHRYLGSLAQRCVSAGLREPGSLRFIADEVEALAELGDLDQAERVLEPFEERSRALDRPFGLALSARCRALIAAGRADLGRAAELLVIALLEHDRCPEPVETARTMLVLGEVQRRMKKKQAARDSLERARGIFEGLGARVWAERAEAAMQRLGKAPPSPWELTPTEQRIAELVAAGRSNKEVADGLFLSPKTVAANLTKIYLKLGVRSRTELVARIASAPPGPGEPLS